MAEPPPTATEPWRPLTDEEWRAFSDYLPRMGRPPRDRRRTWDAIFWIACSTLPWASLPRDLGDPATACSTLLHAARTGLLDRLLIAVSDHPFAAEPLRPLRGRLARAVRRASRQLRPDTLFLARSLGLAEAIYCGPEALPDLTRPGPVPPPNGPLRLPYIPRRVLRGLPPPRLPARPVPVPEPPTVLPRRPSQGATAGRGRGRR